MNLSEKLRRLAAKIEEDADEILAEAEDSEPIFQLVLQAVAESSVALEDTAEMLDKVGASGIVTPNEIAGLAALATQLDSSDDPAMQKQASVLDELLLTLAAPKNAVAQIKANTEDELARLREKYRNERREELYSGPGEELKKQRNAAQSAKAVEQQVTKRRPMQEPLQTRYSPDMPGVPLIRITDGVYQCSATGKIYNYHTGYTTAKGVQIPGTSVQRQTELNDPLRGHTMFTTRENIMARFTALNDEGVLKKLAGIFGESEESVNPQFQEVIDKTTELQEMIGSLDPEIKGPALEAVIAALSRQKETTPAMSGEESPSLELGEKPSEPLLEADDGMQAVASVKKKAAEVMGALGEVPFDPAVGEKNFEDYEKIVSWLRENDDAAYQQLTMMSGMPIVPGDAEGDRSHEFWGGDAANSLLQSLREEHPEALEESFEEETDVPVPEDSPGEFE